MLHQSVGLVPLPDVSHFPGQVEPGARLGSYEILCCVASGGMASVWVARQRGPRGFTKLVALKTILPDLALDRAFEQMFLEEALLASRIRHPNVCEIFELVEHRGTLALSMDWVDGDTLSNLLTVRDGPLEPRIAARIVAQAAAGLHAAHELRDERGALVNLVHRDVSPMNILISRDGHVKLSDFGIAKALTSQREVTAVGHVKGKFSYMSPEQARADFVDRRSDVFSLGVVLYCCSLGALPFRRDGESIQAALARRQACEFDRPSRLRPGYPPALERIILRALQKDPAHRYQTAADMRMDLERWLAASGSLVIEADVAAVLMARRGRSIEERDAKIRKCCAISAAPAQRPELPSLAARNDPDSDSDPTLVARRAPIASLPPVAVTSPSDAPIARVHSMTFLRALFAGRWRRSVPTWAKRWRSSAWTSIKRRRWGALTWAKCWRWRALVWLKGWVKHWRWSALTAAKRSRLAALALALLFGAAALSMAYRATPVGSAEIEALTPAPTARTTPAPNAVPLAAAPAPTAAPVASNSVGPLTRAAVPKTNTKATNRSGANSRRRPSRRAPATSTATAPRGADAGNSPRF